MSAFISAHHVGEVVFHSALSSIDECEDEGEIMGSHGAQSRTFTMTATQPTFVPWKCLLTVGGIKVGFDRSVAKPIQERNFSHLLVKSCGASLTYSLTQRI